jgi:hypothetical protein
VSTKSYAKIAHVLEKVGVERKMIDAGVSSGALVDLDRRLADDALDPLLVALSRPERGTAGGDDGGLERDGEDPRPARGEATPQREREPGAHEREHEGESERYVDDGGVER